LHCITPEKSKNWNLQFFKDDTMEELQLKQKNATQAKGEYLLTSFLIKTSKDALLHTN